MKTITQKLASLFLDYKQYWLGKTKSKRAFRLIQNAFNMLLQNFKNIHITEFSSG